MARGKGRNDYPVEVLWGTFVVRIILRHVTMEACLAELRRNEDLRRVIGITSDGRVPHSWNMSRFENLLGEEPFRTMVKKIFVEMIKEPLHNPGRISIIVACLMASGWKYKEWYHLQGGRRTWDERIGRRSGPWQRPVST